jgi:hypothetical protein
MDRKHDRVHVGRDVIGVGKGILRIDHDPTTPSNNLQSSKTPSDKVTKPKHRTVSQVMKQLLRR